MDPRESEIFFEELERMRHERNSLLQDVTNFTLQKSSLSMFPMWKLINLIRIDLASLREMTHSMIRESVYQQCQQQQQQQHQHQFQQFKQSGQTNNERNKSRKSRKPKSMPEEKFEHAQNLMDEPSPTHSADGREIDEVDGPVLNGEEQADME